MTNKELILTPSKAKMVLLLLVCLLFVVGGAMMLDEEPVAGWTGIIFFGLGIVVSVVNMIPNSSYLKLTEDGFEMKSLFKTNFTGWEDVWMFYPGKMNGNNVVFIEYSAQSTKYKTGRKIAKAIGGHEGMLDTYGLSSEELTETLMEWKNNHAEKTKKTTSTF
ncbi:MAG: hypothetical protein H6603_11355 [Flavobacteriales bacterium]|nr:hypothetical protein [Flavobacteriales bacterium]